MKNNARSRTITVSPDGKGLVSQALERWRAPQAVHDLGKIVADLAVALALGGNSASQVKAVVPLACH